MIGVLLSALLDVRSIPLRTLAAIAGMVAAVVAVVLINAAAVISRDANDAFIARNYGRPVTYTIQADGSPRDSGMWLDMESTLRSNGIASVSIVGGLAALVKLDGQQVGYGMNWIAPDYPRIRVIDVLAGEWPTTTGQSDTLHAVVTDKWVDDTLRMPYQDVVGLKLEWVDASQANLFDQRYVSHRTLIVDAVVAGDSAAFQTFSGVIIVSDQHTNYMEGTGIDPSFVVRVDEDRVPFLNGLIDRMTDDNGRPVFRLQRADWNDDLAPLLDQQDVTARAVTFVAFTLGGLGILGVGVAGVRERAREFGLRRALGSSKTRIFFGVIVQTLLETMLAAVIAIPIAALLLKQFARDLVLETLPLPGVVSLPIETAVLGLTGALLVGLVAGIIPAVSAARASVVQALRA